MLLSAMLMVGVGVVSAQTSGSIQAVNQPSNTNQTKVTDLSKKDAIVSKSETNMVTPQNGNNTNSITKTKITKEEWDNQSERGRQYILAHPELYIVEEK